MAKLTKIQLEEIKRDWNKTKHVHIKRKGGYWCLTKHRLSFFPNFGGKPITRVNCIFITKIIESLLVKKNTTILEMLFAFGGK